MFVESEALMAAARLPRSIGFCAIWDCISSSSSSSSDGIGRQHMTDRRRKAGGKEEEAGMEAGTYWN